MKIKRCKLFFHSWKTVLDTETKLYRRCRRCQMPRINEYNERQEITKMDLEFLRTGWKYYYERRRQHKQKNWIWK